jgi:Holliday junction resolvase RusA-like endonuclease
VDDIAKSIATFLRFEIPGIIKPYVRMTRRGKWVDPEAREYLASKAAIAMQLRAQMAFNERNILPPQTALRCYVLVQRVEALHRCDLDNIVKAVLDSAQGIAFHNDCWIDSIWACRWMGSEDVVKFGVGLCIGTMAASAEQALEVVGVIQKETEPCRK